MGKRKLKPPDWHVVRIEPAIWRVMRDAAERSRRTVQMHINAVLAEQINAETAISRMPAEQPAAG